MPKFTDKTVAALKPGPVRKDVFDDLVPGLALRVNTGGSKVWTLFYRAPVPDDSGHYMPGKQQRRWTIGAYPSVTLSAARQRARKALLDLTDKGIDPAETKADARKADSFKDLADDYMKRYAKVEKRSWDQDERLINAELIPAWGRTPAKAITRRDVRALLDGIVDRGSPVMANRALALISGIFKHGIKRDIVDANPATLIDKQPEAPRDRELSDDEIRELWAALERCKAPLSPDATPALPKMIALGLQVLLLTAQRPGEVFEMRRQDLDLSGGWWTIPGTMTKNREPHRVALVPEAVALIETAIKDGPVDGKWVFSGVPIGNVAARAKKAASALSHAKAIGFQFRRHDLRRTAASGMARAGVDGAIISRTLNHVDGGPRATRIYNVYDYHAEKRTAAEAWARRLRRILDDANETGTVVPMRGAR